MFPLESLFYPCCTPAVLHALSQSGFLLLGAGSLSAAVGLNKLPSTVSNTASCNPSLDRTFPIER
ncbi:MAG: hypothetical protein HC847_15960 [Hydrococcus sp. RU_2_2]|jgi:hypothetical protein|nr:hypothetical protein [Hydrococcus sp. RU_2_2]